MDKKLFKVIQWTLYVFIVIVLIIGYFVPFGIYIFDKSPSDKIINWINYAGIGLSILSVILAFYSLFSSNESQKKLELSLSDVMKIQNESDTILHEVKIITQTIQNSQDRIESHLSITRSVSETIDGTNLSAWTKDKTGPNE